jgi:hypothetical protein
MFSSRDGAGEFTTPALPLSSWSKPPPALGQSSTFQPISVFGLSRERLVWTECISDKIQRYLRSPLGTQGRLRFSQEFPKTQERHRSHLGIRILQAWKEGYGRAEQETREKAASQRSQEKYGGEALRRYCRATMCQKSRISSSLHCPYVEGEPNLFQPIVSDAA